MCQIESHPFQPFLPENAGILFLGSFPPQEKRWCMPFYYPNWTNDFWRVMGLLFHQDRDWFAVSGEKRFDREKVQAFCREQGLALYDTACEVRRLQDNASDKFLEVVRATDIPALLARIPECHTLVTTGEKASTIIANTFGCLVPLVGGYVDIETPDQPPVGAEGGVGGNGIDVMPDPDRASRPIRFWRMPSTSRAYPLPLEKKAEAYRKLFK